ncbi:DUF7282 domain-containing protein [Natronobiforma cellulositropha]|uniref:DUF7282 domain-containing protein n=1 Tax=Natronobiforma cellulositropha TaxID=1679076 RepID=UPI0021D5D6DD|nr:DUF4179 domain-containing protein [Natronobiforma cellulositropha]
MSTTQRFGTVKRIGAILIAVAIVLAAGTVVGQAPMLFGAEVADEPEASIAFADQTGDGTSVVVDNVSLSDGGFVVVADGHEVVGVSAYLESGSHEEVVVDQRGDEDLEMLGALTATVYHDATENETFVHESEAAEGDDHDRPYVDDGYPVSDTATVTMSDDISADATTSLSVESVDAPETAAVNTTLEITAEVHNPNDAEIREHVDVRLGGQLYERQLPELEPNETRELTFSVDLNGTDPGAYVYGVYTAHDGSLGEVYLEYDAEPDLRVLAADGDALRLDATLPADGFLAVEDDEGSPLATSDALGPGAHENVTLDLDGLADGETVTVVAYEGEPSALEDEEATAFTDEDGERIETTVTIGEEFGAAEETDDEGDAEE